MDLLKFAQQCPVLSWLAKAVWPAVLNKIMPNSLEMSQAQIRVTIEICDYQELNYAHLELGCLEFGHQYLVMHVTCVTDDCLCFLDMCVAKDDLTLKYLEHPSKGQVIFLLLHMYNLK